VKAGSAELMALMSLPLIVGGVCILTSIIGTYIVRLGSSNSIMGALYKGFWTTALLSVPAIYYVTWRSGRYEHGLWRGPRRQWRLYRHGPVLVHDDRPHRHRR
jgi:Na+/H+-translocating membrane pyrophosphatase